MTYERQQRIRELQAELAELQRLEEMEASMVRSGWTPMEGGFYRRPAPHRPWWVRNGEFKA